jgi:hypothetical protein
MLCSNFSYIRINITDKLHEDPQAPLRAPCLAFKAARIVLQKIVEIHYAVTLKIETARSFEVSEQTCYPTRYKIFEDQLYAYFPKIQDPPQKF